MKRERPDPIDTESIPEVLEYHNYRFPGFCLLRWWRRIFCQNEISRLEFEAQKAMINETLKPRIRLPVMD